MYHPNYYPKIQIEIPYSPYLWFRDFSVCTWYWQKYHGNTMYMNTPVTVPFSSMYRHCIWIGTVRFAITSYWHIFVQYLSTTKNWIGSIFQDPFSIQVFVFGKPYRTYRSQSFNIKWWHSQMFYSQNSVCKGGQSLDSFEP